MKNKLVAVSILLLAVFLFLTGKGCKKQTGIKLEKGSDDLAILRIDTRSGKLDIEKSQGKPQRGGSVAPAKRFSNLRRAEIVLGPAGEVTIKSPTSGFVKEPGLFAFYGSKTEASYGIGTQYFYYRRSGLYGSVSYSPSRKSFQAQATVGFIPSPQKAPNTALLLGVDTHKDIIVGMTVKF